MGAELNPEAFFVDTSPDLDRESNASYRENGMHVVLIIWFISQSEIAVTSAQFEGVEECRAARWNRCRVSFQVKLSG